MGFAGITAGCFGVAGTVVGMAEVWYTGPLAVKAGGMFGTDLGFEVCHQNFCRIIQRADIFPQQLAAAFAAVTFLPLRWLEIKFTGR